MGTFIHFASLVEYECTQKNLLKSQLFSYGFTPLVEKQDPLKVLKDMYSFGVKVKHYSTNTKCKVYTYIIPSIIFVSLILRGIAPVAERWNLFQVYELK